MSKIIFIALAALLIAANSKPIPVSMKAPGKMVFPSGTGTTGTSYTMAASFQFGAPYGAWRSMWHVSSKNINVPRNPALFIINNAIHPCYTTTNNGNQHFNSGFKAYVANTWYTIVQSVGPNSQQTWIIDETDGAVKEHKQAGAQPTVNSNLDGTYLYFCQAIYGYAAHPTCRNLRMYQNYAFTQEDATDLATGKGDGSDNGKASGKVEDKGPQCDDDVKDSDNVVLCSECGFSGDRFDFDEDKEDCIDFYPQSIHVPEGKKLTLFDDCNFQGQDSEISGDQECLNSETNLLENHITLKGKKHALKKNSQKQIKQNLKVETI